MQPGEVELELLKVMADGKRAERNLFKPGGI